jgi:hypothetical protein
MAQNQKNNRLEDLFLRCSLVLFAKPNLEGFSKADEFKSCVETDSLIYYSGYKILNPRTVAIDIHFYTISNKYELKNKLKNLSDKYSLGLSYRISELQD